MILSFMKTFDGNRKTHFRERILKGLHPELLTEKEAVAVADKAPKIHTIRRGERWYKGAVIHLATGARTKYYDNFATLKCKGVQEIDITYFPERGLEISIDGFYFYRSEWEEFSLNDGFDTVEDFESFFESQCQLFDGGGFHGQIIHWTDKLYGKEVPNG